MRDLTISIGGRPGHDVHVITFTSSVRGYEKYVMWHIKLLLSPTSCILSCQCLFNSIKI